MRVNFINSYSARPSFGNQYANQMPKDKNYTDMIVRQEKEMQDLLLSADRSAEKVRELKEKQAEERRDYHYLGE